MRVEEVLKTVTIAKEFRAQELAPLSLLLETVAGYIRRYVMLTPEQTTACALWVLHTHVFDAAETTPYIEITSPEKQSGKTRLLEVLEHIVARPWFTGRVSSAVLYRKVEKEKPTLLLDESDAAFKGNPEYSETLRGILNSGYRAGGKTTICIGQGKNISYQDFSCFCPKAIAGINKLPDTVRDRAITIEMRRRAPGEQIERMRRRNIEKVSQSIREAIEQWAIRNTQLLAGARPDIPDELSDRSADCWEPLFAIADLADHDWQTRARQAARLLSGHTVKEDESIGIKLLSDIRNVFGNEEKMFSDELCLKLRGLEESPWGELPFGTRRGKELDARTLAFYLKGYGIKPKQIKKDDIGKKGYNASDFQDIWNRYLPGSPTDRNERNQGNQSDEKVSLVSQVSVVQDGRESPLISDLPPNAKAHHHEFVPVTNWLGTFNCCVCGEFPPKEYAQTGGAP